MPDLPAFVWSFVWAGPPIVAAVGAGVWLLRRGDRLVGLLFLAWGATRILVTLLRYYVNSYWIFEPGRTSGQQDDASVVSACFANSLTAVLLIWLVAAVLVRKGSAR